MNRAKEVTTTWLTKREEPYKPFENTTIKPIENGTRFDRDIFWDGGEHWLKDKNFKSVINRVNMMLKFDNN